MKPPGFYYETVFDYAGLAHHLAYCRERRDGLLPPYEAVARR